MQKLSSPHLPIICQAIHSEPQCPKSIVLQSPINPAPTSALFLPRQPHLCSSCSTRGLHPSSPGLQQGPLFPFSQDKSCRKGAGRGRSREQSHFSGRVRQEGTEPSGVAGLFLPSPSLSPVKLISAPQGRRKSSAVCFLQ